MLAATGRAPHVGAGELAGPPGPTLLPQSLGAALHCGKHLESFLHFSEIAEVMHNIG